jgi:hypothetical protein
MCVSHAAWKKDRKIEELDPTFGPGGRGHLPPRCSNYSSSQETKPFYDEGLGREGILRKESHSWYIVAISGIVPSWYYVCISV